MRDRKGKQLTILEKQFIVLQLIEGISNHYGKNRFGEPMLDFAKNGLCKEGQ
jgi:hypothetical protein